MQLLVFTISRRFVFVLLGDYGTIPKHAPFTMHAALQNHFLKGVSYPIGGSSEIGFHIIPTITRAGGSVFVRAEVDSIITSEDGSVATGVRMKKDGKVISAPVIISNAGLFNTTEKLLAPPASARMGGMMEHVQHGNGGLSVYVGLNGTAEELGLEGKHYWAMWTRKGQEDLDAITEKYMARSQKDAAKGVIPLLFISFPSAKDPLWPGKHPGKSTATIVTFANYDWFKEVSIRRASCSTRSKLIPLLFLYILYTAFLVGEWSRNASWQGVRRA